MVKMKTSSLPPEIVRNVDAKIFNEAYLPYLLGIWGYEVYFGGRGSGKSHFIAHKLAWQLSESKNSGRNLMCVRKSKNDASTSVYTEMYKALQDLKLLHTWNVVEHPSIHLENIANHNEIVFGGMDDVENIKSYNFKNGNMTDLWYEEATEEYDMRNLRQLDAGMRDPVHKTRLILSFNPILASHPIKKFIEEELMPTGDCIFLKTTYKDNKFLKPDYGQKLEKTRFTDPYMYMVNVLGEWGTTGQSVFDNNKLHNRMRQLGELYGNNPPLEGEFSYSEIEHGVVDINSFQFFPCTDGQVKIYKDVERGHPYVLAFDTAGETGDDFHACQVIDNISGEQVAVYHSKKSPVFCVYQAMGLCKHYNDALFVPEVNFDSYHLNKFKELGYRNIYQRGTPVDNYTEGYVQKLGFRTHVGNRKQMLADCVEFVNKNTFLINDPQTLTEMMTFTNQEKKMKGVFWGAEPGTHDDLVMSYAIALQARQQASCEISAELEGTLTGMWLPSQLKSAVEAGRITHEQKKEYEKNHTGHARIGTGINKNAIKRRSRYDR